MYAVWRAFFEPTTRMGFCLRDVLEVLIPSLCIFGPEIAGGLLARLSRYDEHWQQWERGRVGLMVCELLVVWSVGLSSRCQLHCGATSWQSKLDGHGPM